jgi:hypothetical protein
MRAVGAGARTLGAAGRLYGVARGARPPRVVVAGIWGVAGWVVGPEEEEEEEEARDKGARAGVTRLVERAKRGGAAPRAGICRARDPGP